MWDERYAEEDLAYGAEPNDFVREVHAQLPGGACLCLAEGQGRNAVFLAGLPQITAVTALDASAVGMRRAAALAAAGGVELETVVADLADYRFEPGWSVIVETWAHLPPELRRRVHRDAVAALRPGGAYVLESYTPAQIGRGTGGPPMAERMMTLEGLREELAGLDFVIGRELEREVAEGKYHRGLSSVVQVLGVKPE